MIRPYSRNGHVPPVTGTGPRHRRRIAVVMEPDMFDWLDKKSKAMAWSFSRTLRHYVELGIEKEDA